MKKPTSFDVAKLAGVDRSVVSRALSGGGRISEETRKRVVAAAHELGYRVNFLARGLQNQSSDLVGVVASRLDTPFRALQVKVIAGALLRQGYSPLLIAADGDDDLAPLLSRLLSYNVAGMILTSDSPPAEIVEACERIELPVVLINRRTNNQTLDRVQLDVRACGQLAFDMLWGCGCRRFAVLDPLDETFSVAGRAQAFADICRENDAAVRVIQPQGQTYRDGLQSADLFAPHASEVDGVFCSTDLLALGFLDGVRLRHGLSVPDQIQIIGFDDIEQAGWLGNNLSTIFQDVQSTAEAAVELMLDRIHNPGQAPQSRAVEIGAVHRGTTRQGIPQ